MSRSGYTDDADSEWAAICWRGAVASAIKGQRGQAFLREMAASLDSLEAKRLITGDLIHDGAVCALGAVGAARGLDMSNLDPYDRESTAAAFGVAPALAAEIMYLNDEWPGREKPEERFARMRRWVEEQIALPQEGSS